MENDMAAPKKEQLNMDELMRIQHEAVAEGRKAEREGRRVIYIHGQPYADPGDDPAE